MNRDWSKWCSAPLWSVTWLILYCFLYSTPQRLPHHTSALQHGRACLSSGFGCYVEKGALWAIVGKSRAASRLVELICVQCLPIHVSTRSQHLVYGVSVGRTSPRAPLIRWCSLVIPRVCTISAKCIDLFLTSSRLWLVRFHCTDPLNILLGSTFSFQYISEGKSSEPPVLYSALASLHLPPRRMMKQIPGLTIAAIIERLCSYPYIVLPVHLPHISHWILLVIYNAKGFYAENDCGAPPYIFTMDSLCFDNVTTRDTIIGWFQSVIPLGQFTKRSDVVSVDLRVGQSLYADSHLVLTFF